MQLLKITAYDGYKRDPRLFQADGFVIKSIFLDELKEKVAVFLDRQTTVQEEMEAKKILTELRRADLF